MLEGVSGKSKHYDAITFGACLKTDNEKTLFFIPGMLRNWVDQHLETLTSDWFAKLYDMACAGKTARHIAIKDPFRYDLQIWYETTFTLCASVQRGEAILMPCQRYILNVFVLIL